MAVAGWFAGDGARSDAQTGGQSPPGRKTVNQQKTSPAVKKTIPSTAAEASVVIPRDEDIQTEFRAIHAELDRLQAATYASDRYSPRFDWLRQIEAGLDVLERGLLGESAPMAPAKAPSKRE
jgi:hypothetical protein